MAPGLKQVRIAMRDGSYNDHCWIQEAAMRAALDLIPNYHDRNSLAVVDYGCSQGANSVEPLRKIISTLPSDAALRLFFEDTPFNDFSSLGKTIADKILTLAPRDKDISITPAMIPVGFFQQVVPDNSVDLGLSWSSFNYLESTPNATLDPESSPAEYVSARRKAFSGVAAKDLLKILCLRAVETREGGYLIAAIEGQKPTNDPRPPNTGSAPLQAALLKMLGMGKITREELSQMAHFPSYERTTEEILAALNDPDVAALWTVGVFEQKLIEHPAWETYQTKLKLAGDNSTLREAALRTYAEDIVNNLASSSGWFGVDVLKRLRGADWDGGEAFLDEWTRLGVEELVENFADMKVELWYHYMKLRRTSTE